MREVTRLLFVVALWLTSASASPANGSDARLDAPCRPYFGSACSAEIGRWLPKLTFDPKRVPLAASGTTVYDRLIDPGDEGVLGFLGSRVLAHGTLFVYGNAGPPKGKLVYDPVHRVVLFDEGCCGWHRVVTAVAPSAPPKRVVERDLSRVHTRTGLMLGATAAQVRSIYGNAPAQPVPRHPDELILAYARPIRFPKPYTPCVEESTFLFRSARLALIELAAVC